MAHEIFEEKQRFIQVWLWVIILGVSIMVIVKTPLQLIESAGNGPMSASSIVSLIFSFVCIIGLNALFYFSLLKTKISSSGVEITFHPFINTPKIFKWEHIEKAFVRKYQPIWEYGGWGIRHRWNSIAYNTSGNKGLQLILKSGKKVLIGTQKPEELESYLKKYIFTCDFDR